MSWIKSLLWFLTGRCWNCGGTIAMHINGKEYCDDCGQKQ